MHYKGLHASFRVLFLAPRYESNYFHNGKCYR